MISLLVRRQQQRVAVSLGRALERISPYLVCVDYFDTLVSRTCSRQDVKRIAAEELVQNGLISPALDIAELRRRSERELSDASEKDGLDREFDIGAVARHIHHLAGLESDVDAFERAVVAADVAAEITAQRLNAPLVEQLRHVAPGTRLALVSDFYHPADALRIQLAAHGIDDLFDTVVVSCDLKLSKASGRLYPEVLSIVDHDPVTDGPMLMIGDNAHSDGAMARQHGFDTFAIPGPPRLAEFGASVARRLARSTTGARSRASTA